jgi:hypothetical protein
MMNLVYTASPQQQLNNNNNNDNNSKVDMIDDDISSVRTDLTTISGLKREKERYVAALL